MTAEGREEREREGETERNRDETERQRQKDEKLDKQARGQTSFYKEPSPTTRNPLLTQQHLSAPQMTW